MKLKAMVLASAALVVGLATAQPSVYYLWKNVQTGKTACEPVAIDANWVKVSETAYQDPNCTILMPE